jgi:small subunit ribosomal protein S1
MKNSEQFGLLFEESLKSCPMELGTELSAKVISIGKDYVIVDAGFKSESVIPVEEFYDIEPGQEETFVKGEAHKLSVSVGDEVDVVLMAIEDGFGETRLSREKAKRAASWKFLEKAKAGNKTVMGIISGKVKGGFTVEIDSIRAFLPGSLVDIRPVRDSSFLEGKELEFKVIKMDIKRNNVVVSRRAVVEAESSAERVALLENLEEGSVVKGVVKNLTDYGAFIDLGGIDGLLHITDMSWKRIKHPTELINVGDEISVVVLKFDRDRNRVSLGLKQLGNDPWYKIEERYPVGNRLKGKVTNIADYGCFVEIEDGVEGLVHVSEMSWTNKNIHPAKVVQLGEQVEVLVLEINGERRRISLGLKQTTDNPWIKFVETHKEGDKVTGAIKSITDFGVFIGLDSEIDGLVHLSDLSWHESGDHAARQYKRGQEVEAVIVAMDPERERISLGIKQLQDDPTANFLNEHPKGEMVTGIVMAVDAKGATVSLADGINGYIRVSEIGDGRGKDAEAFFKLGDSVEAKIMTFDRKIGLIQLSAKAKRTFGKQEQAVMSSMGDSAIKSTLGDLFKEKMGDNNAEKDDAAAGD